MNKYLKNVKLRLGVLTVEVALIFSLVIVIGHFFLPGNGMMKHLDGIIDVVLGRVSSDEGNYEPSELGGSEGSTENKDPLNGSIVQSAIQNHFSIPEIQKQHGEGFNDIISVKIITNNGSREIKFLSNKNNGSYKNAASYFEKSQHINDLLEALKDVPDGEYTLNH